MPLSSSRPVLRVAPGRSSAGGDDPTRPALIQGFVRTLLGGKVGTSPPARRESRFRDDARDCTERPFEMSTEKTFERFFGAFGVVRTPHQGAALDVSEF